MHLLPSYTWWCLRMYDLDAWNCKCKCKRTHPGSDTIPTHVVQETHDAKLRQALDTGGDASLQNALDLAVDSLKSIPPYGHR